MASKYDNYDNAITVKPHKTVFFDERYFLGGKYTKLSEKEDDVATSNEFGYRCFLYPSDTNRGYDYLDLTDIVASASWEEDLDSAAMELDLTVWDPVLDNSRELNTISKGDRVSFYVRDYEDNKMKPVNNFVIWEISKGSSRSPTINIHAYDNLIYLLKSEDTFLFNKSTSSSKKGWTASEITEYVCDKHGVDTGYIAKAKHRIPYFRVDSSNIYEVLLKAWTEERKETDVRYLIRMNNNKLEIRAKQDRPIYWEVRSGHNLIDIDFTDSLEGMYSAVRAVSAKEDSENTKSPNTPTTEEGDYAAPDGGGWRTGAATFYEVMEETGLSCTGYSLSRGLRGYAELSNNHTAPLSQLDFSAMGGLSCGQKVEVKYKGKTIIIPKVDVGRGGVGIGSVPRQIDLTNAAWDALVGTRSTGKVLVEWRIAGGISGEADVDNASGRAKSSAGKTSADVIAVHEEMVESYGYTQKMVPLNPNVKLEKAQELATNALYEASRENYEANLTCYFLPFLRAGDPIYVKDEGTGLDGRYYCSDVSHEMSVQGSRTRVGLNWLDVVPELEIDDGEKKPRQTRRPATGTGSGVAPYGTPGGIIPGSSTCGAAVIEKGATKLHTPYLWGGKGPDRFDCSGFVAWCWWEAAGVYVPSFTDSIAQMIMSGKGESIAKGHEQVGDLVLYKHDPNQPRTVYGHVALWAGPNRVLECGGQVRPSGVGWSNRNDHVLTVRVSHQCKERTEPAVDQVVSRGIGEIF